jgi:nicotinamidase-related amidase/type 1 glutamine amidotransferase
VNVCNGRVLFLHGVLGAVEERFGVSSSSGSPEGLLYENCPPPVSPLHLQPLDGKTPFECNWAMRTSPLRFATVIIAASTLCSTVVAEDEASYKLTARTSVKQNDGTYQKTQKSLSWDASKTAVIVCDMWDAHHCLNATQRGAEMAPRMNEVLKKARESGSTIIHAPSSCMEFYKDHPARARAQETAKSESLPNGIEKWLNWINAEEEKAGYPIDHSDGGEDDEAEAHAAWAKELSRRGRNSGAPWIRQSELLEIDPQRDFITDDGVENWSILESKKIENVVLVGVHTNMCVLGRPFGLRQMARSGKNVVLMRDLTDTMYNPKMPPYVSHFRGTDLIIDHVEKFVCPTITSDQLIGGQPNHFKNDQRKHLVIIMAEKEYKTAQTLPKFAEEVLGDDFRLSYIFGDQGENSFDGLNVLAEAEAALISVRRRALPVKQLKALRDFVAAGKPVIGIRTASHAFSLRDKEPPKGTATWESFDGDVWGGNYNGHHANKVKTAAWVDEKTAEHALLRGLDTKEFPTGGSLYKVLPLKNGTTPLLMGRTADSESPEPVAWTFARSDGGKSFYTSLGHIDDFRNTPFRQLLLNAIHWAVGNEIPEGGVTTAKKAPQK